MSKRKILIIDDDRSICETLELEFQSRGYDTRSSLDGESGLKSFEEYSPDLVLLDLRLPDCIGIDVLKKIKEIKPEQVVIMMTAHDDMENTIQAVQSGVYDYIHKPLDLDQLEMALGRALQIRELSDRMEGIVSEISNKYRLNRLVGKSPGMLEVFKSIGAATTSKVTVLITGESGTGKELIARAIHYNSKYKAYPFVAINCGAIPENLFESELFGYVRGAFTGAAGDHAGKLESAEEGTLFLDEISELPPQMQVKLLRVLQERVYSRLGSNQELEFNARLIAATNTDLEELVKEGRFREDLYYRLKVMEIDVPPLRARREDIPALTEFLIDKINKEFDKNITHISPGIFQHLQKFGYPGNVRQLENILRRAVVMAKSDTLFWDDLAPFVDMESKSAEMTEGGLTTLDEMEKRHLLKVLEATGWNKSKACRVLDISRPTLDRKIEKYDLGSD
ncbi:MAG: response regulator [candidate division Zixibacteria bacterium]|nr:response regulator [candidate division Zixibacteria bacterium]